MKIYYLNQNANQAALQVLGKTGAELTVVKTTEEMDTLLASPPALCLIDLEIPLPQKGLDYAKKISAKLEKSVPIYAFYSTNDESLAASARAAGIEQIFRKPTDQKQFLLQLAKYINTPEVEQLKEALSGGVLVGKLEQIEGFAEFTPPAEMTKVIDNYSELLIELRSFVCEADDSSEKMKFYMEHLAEIEEEYVDYINKLAKRKEPLLIEQCIFTYGIEKTRDLLIARQIFSYFFKGVPYFNADSGQPEVKPETVLNYARLCEEHFGIGSRYSNAAFFTGLVFDLIKIHNDVKNKGNDTVKDMLNSLFKNGLLLADSAFKLAKSGESVRLEKMMIPVCMLANFGEVFFTLEHPKYSIIREKFENAKLAKILLLYWEETAFKIHSNAIASLFCLFAPALQEAHRALLFLEIPFMLTDDEADNRQLARVCRKARQHLKKQKATDQQAS